MIDALVSWCEKELDSSDDEQRTSLGDSLAEAVRTLLANAILPRLLSFAGEKIIENVAHVPAETGRRDLGRARGGDRLPRGGVGRSRRGDRHRRDGAQPTSPRSSRRTWASRSAAPSAAQPRSSPSRPTPTDSNLQAVLSTATVRTRANALLKVLAGLVLADELATLLEDEGLIPAWIAPLFHLRGDADRHARLGRIWTRR